MPLGIAALGLVLFTVFHPGVRRAAERATAQAIRRRDAQTAPLSVPPTRVRDAVR